jgi:putative ABC transport system permease protein
MRFYQFVVLSFKRLTNRLSLTLLVILSMAITVAMTVCVPVFSESVSRKIMQEEMALQSHSIERPPFSVRFSALPTTKTPMTIEDVDYAGEWIGDMLSREVGLPIVSSYTQYESPTMYLRREPPVEGDTSVKRTDSVAVTFVRNIGDHITVTNGIGYGSADGVPQGALSVWVLNSLAQQLELQIGDTYYLSYSPRPGFTAIPLYIAGYWEATDPQEGYWYLEPETSFGNALLTTEDQYRTILEPMLPEGTGYDFWYYVFDDSRMSLDRVGDYLRGIKVVESDVHDRLPSGTLGYAPSDALEQARQRKNALSMSLFSFALPLLGILAFFIASVSAIVARYQQGEAAMLISRGVSRWQLLLLFLGETGLIIAISTPLGVLAGMAIARLLSHSDGFMRFVPTTGLPTYFSSINWLLVGAGILLGLLSRLAPTWLATRSNIVSYERSSARREATFGIARVVLMVVMGALTYYTYYRLANTGSLAFITLQGDADPLRDPLLLLAPTLFLFTASLIISEVFILLMRSLSLVSGWVRGAATYLGVTNLAREGSYYRVPIYLLVLCLNLGVFYASLAKSADIWLADRLAYQVGADYTFTHAVGGVSTGGLLGTENYFGDAGLLPMTAFTEIPGVQAATRIGEYRGDLDVLSDVPSLRLIGINRLEFPQVAYWRSDYASTSLGDLMNRLGLYTDGLLLPTDYAAELNLVEGDQVHMKVGYQVDGQWFETEISLTYVGSFDYFPTMYESEAPVAVVNLSYLESDAGVVDAPNIWLNLEPTASTADVLASLKLLMGDPEVSQDLNSLLVTDQRRLERVGIFGMLSFCFLASALLAGLGMLVYGFSALSSRIYRFAVLRAMGLRLREMIGVISLEYAVAMVYSLVVGVLLGALTSLLYVPFYPLTSEPTQQIPPFLPYTDWSSAIWITLVMAVTLSVIESGVLARMARTPAFQALRLGSRE